MSKQRADALLVSKGLVESRSLAQRMVMAGQVRADGQLVSKPSVLLAENVALEIEALPRFVSRGGNKLEAALSTFAINVTNFVCADVGASTGGFCDCLLQHGANKVYAIDVGRGQLHWKLRQDERVVVMEKTNARNLTELPEKIDLVTVDASFISLKVLLPVVRGWMQADGQVLALIKPQFEAGRKEVSRGKGVIRDSEVHRDVLRDVISFAMDNGYTVLGLTASPLRGPKGNVEFLAHLALKGDSPRDLNTLIDGVLVELIGSSSDVNE
jgi:23S rRNA (cytidine1920-2'-O)/16S rRNA (cytidine1409-2'-O)-methyltransferase